MTPETLFDQLEKDVERLGAICECKYQGFCTACIVKHDLRELVHVLEGYRSFLRALGVRS